MRLYDDPPDLERIHETSLEHVTEWALQLVGGPGGLSELARRIRNEMPKELAPLLECMIEGDALWWCRSAKRGPLNGHEGVALVRQDQVLMYLQMLNY